MSTSVNMYNLISKKSIYFYAYYTFLPIILLCSPSIPNVESTTTITNTDSITPVDGGEFKSLPCADPSVQTMLRATPAKTRTSPISTVIQCAVFCNRDRMCKWAIFNEKNKTKTCEQFYELTNTLGPINKEYTHSNSFPAVDDVDDEDAAAPKCTVLMKKVAHPIWARLEFAQLTNLENIDKFSQLKFVKQTPTKISVYSVTEFTVSPPDEPNEWFSVATSNKIVAATLMTQSSDSSFTKPLKTKMYLMSGDASELRSALLLYVQVGDAQSEISTDVSTDKDYFMWKQTDPKDVVIAETIDDAIDLSVTHGYRRLDRYPTRIQIDVRAREILVDMTLTTHVGNPGEASQYAQDSLFYFKSIKEQYTGDSKQAKRSVLKHQMLEDSQLPSEESTIPEAFPWIFESSWRKVTGNDFIQEVKDAIRQGKPIRLLLKDELLTDTIAVCVTPKNVMVALAPYISPFTWESSHGSSSHEIRFPIFEGVDRTLVVCKSTSTKGNRPYTPVAKQLSSAVWFVSTKTWTKIFEIGHDKTVHSGSLTALKKSVADGETIRACVEEIISDHEIFYCFEVILAASKLNFDPTIFESQPFLHPYETFSRYPHRCNKRKQLLVSGDGWVKVKVFDIGVEDTTEPVSVEFERLYWFVERD